MPSDVYFSDMRTRSGRNLLDKVGTLFDKAGLGDLIEKGDFVAIKLHVGEPGNLAYLQPPIVRTIVQKVRARGGKPFLTDSNTLYAGQRSNAVDHMISAVRNGFGYATVDAPFIVADGLHGHDYIKVPVDGKRIKEARIGSAIAEADVLIALSHVKGHEGAGFGGAIKNIGMGSASRAGKQEQHSDIKPKVDTAKCKMCGRCVKWCPAGAINFAPGRPARIDSSKCIGCAECTISCLHEAIGVNWSSSELAGFQERMVEYALAVTKTKDGKCGFMNFVMNVSPDCDCAPWNDVPIVPNQGILASRDPVAIDQASVDLINAAPGLPGTRLSGAVNSNDKFGTIHKVDWRIQLVHGEEIGLGSTSYDLITIR
ncbi:MAG TPA: DUF362 domain-containing protein [Firmicutes bacterium]|nr:DUF362 domain-containing protein [Bacillota bacterium]